METPVLDSPPLPMFFLMFLFVYLFAYFGIFRNWGPTYRAEASSCILSLVHGNPAVLMAVYAILRTQPSPTFASPNSIFQNVVLEYSVGYFLMDLLHYALFCPNDILFILHHLATLYVIVTCRYVVRRGAYGILVLLSLAEVTSAFQNAWTLAGFRKVDDPVAARLYKSLSAPFYIFYSVVRGILGPIVVFRMVMFYLSGEANGLIPGWAWISWIVVVATAILVSISWVSSHWQVWLEVRNHGVQKKIRLCGGELLDGLAVHSTWYDPEFRMKQHADQPCLDREFAVVDIVLLKLEPYPQQSVAQCIAPSISCFTIEGQSSGFLNTGERWLAPRATKCSYNGSSCCNPRSWNV